jgi:hypothetical protein
VIATSALELAFELLCVTVVVCAGGGRRHSGRQASTTGALEAI